MDANEAPNASNDDPDAKGKVGKVKQGTMKARTLFLNKAYSSADLTTELATSEPLQHVRNRFGKYWTRQWQRYLIGASRGVIASNVANNASNYFFSNRGVFRKASSSCFKRYQTIRLLSRIHEKPTLIFA